ncbi:MAG: universal stress protein [Rhodothermaceae bacterium]|nr:universal stress protein [Rhodothermaceae bacterium]
MLRIRSILAPYDFSEHADRALAHAVALAQLHKARLDVLYVVEVRAVPSFDEEGDLHLYTDEPVTDPAERALAHLVERYRDVEVTVQAERGSSTRHILTFAEDHDTDLIVMATHGHTGLRRVLMGSVARAVVDSVSCPVLLLKAFGKTLLPDAAAETGGEKA